MELIKEDDMCQRIENILDDNYQNVVSFTFCIGSIKKAKRYSFHIEFKRHFLETIVDEETNKQKDVERYGIIKYSYKNESFHEMFTKLMSLFLPTFNVSKLNVTKENLNGWDFTKKVIGYDYDVEICNTHCKYVECWTYSFGEFKYIGSIDTIYTVTPRKTIHRNIKDNYVFLCNKTEIEYIKK